MLVLGCGVDGQCPWLNGIDYHYFYYYDATFGVMLFNLSLSIVEKKRRVTAAYQSEWIGENNNLVQIHSCLNFILIW